MVLFVDLEDEVEPPDSTSAFLARLHHRWERDGEGNLISRDSRGLADECEARANPNVNAVTQALGCYPIIAEVASHIDLNTLDALSRTCRQIRVNLLQFRTQLLTSTLHCENEELDPDPENTFRYRARAADWYFVETGRENAGTGKVGDCARDLVGGCRRCGRVVCRNCTIKPPAPVLLQDRHRRICRACSLAPLSTLVSSNPLSQLNPHVPVIDLDLNPSMTSNAVCTCTSGGVWLCQPCGRSLRSQDMEYKGVWSWRSRYLPSLGGLGVGIGEGNRGVPCGRASDCHAAHEVEQEVDCDAEDAREVVSSSLASTAGSHMGPGYTRHEIEGIGGVVKKKLVRMVRVGACVAEFDKDKQFLRKETEGEARSWCGWCWRVVPAKGEILQ